MGIPLTAAMGFLFTTTIGNLFTMDLGIQVTISRAQVIPGPRPLQALTYY
jgi:hypothetical protein